MRSWLTCVALLALTASPVLAQQAPPDSMSSGAQSGPQNPPIKSPSLNNSSASVSGANSFTEGEAAKRIRDRGYQHVSGLQKDSNGVWRGMAMKDGRAVPVSVDYQGNVN